MEKEKEKIAKKDDSVFLQCSLLMGKLNESATLEREKVREMMRIGLNHSDDSCNNFIYSLELSELYESTAVAIQVIANKLEADIHTLKFKCKIKEINNADVKIIDNRK
jgi:hypothetical protein